MDIVKIIAIITSGSILFVVVELIRRNRLRERYGLTWLAAALVMMIFASSRSLLHAISFFVGIHYPPSFLFLLAMAFLLVLLLHFSTVISSLSRTHVRLAQEIGMLKTRISELESGDPNVRGSK